MLAELWRKEKIENNGYNQGALRFDGTFFFVSAIDCTFDFEVMSLDSFDY